MVEERETLNITTWDMYDRRKWDCIRTRKTTQYSIVNVCIIHNPGRLTIPECPLPHPFTLWSPLSSSTWSGFSPIRYLYLLIWQHNGHRHWRWKGNATWIMETRLPSRLCGLRSVRTSTRGTSTIRKDRWLMVVTSKHRYVLVNGTKRYSPPFPPIPRSVFRRWSRC
jgi:hypothetical protein